MAWQLLCVGMGGLSQRCAVLTPFVTWVEKLATFVPNEQTPGARSLAPYRNRAVTAAPNLPLVTILVPVYNGERYLRESLDSIVNQTYRNVEILVLDDCSKDATPEIIAEYGSRVRCFRQPRNRGIYGNVNDGISMAGGELVAVYHADDVYLPTIVEREVEFLVKYPEAGAVFAADVFVDAEGREYGRLELPREVRGGWPLSHAVILNALLTYKNTFLRCPTSMVRASVYRDVGVYRADEFRIASDVEMWLRIARTYPIGILEEHLLRYRHFHGNATQLYYHLRTEPEIHFRIVDEYLAAGGQSLVTSRALAAHEAHRAEDRLMLAVNRYIRNEPEQARALLEEAPVARVLGSPQVKRTRLLILWAALHVLCRLPHSPAVADRFYRRWHVKAPQST
jgi:GT2 family glycosyltransferase